MGRGSAGWQSFNTLPDLTSPAVGEIPSDGAFDRGLSIGYSHRMNDLSQDAWFYAQNGAKGGPVGFSALQQMAKEGKLNPRQDLVWSKGMESWLPAGDIQGLFERRAVVEAPAVAEVVAPAVPSMPVTPTLAEDPYVSPEEVEAYESGELAPAMPGARRRSYLFFLLIFPVLWAALLAGAATFLGSQMPQETLALILSGLLVVPALLVLVFSLMRLVNLGMSRWWFLGNLVPLLNLWVGYRCFACPAGYANHKKMDGPGILLAILYWLVISVGIAAFVALVAVVLGLVGSPEQREDLIDSIKERIEMPAQP